MAGLALRIYLCIMYYADMCKMGKKNNVLSYCGGTLRDCRETSAQTKAFPEISLARDKCGICSFLICQCFSITSAGWPAPPQVEISQYFTWRQKMPLLLLH